MDVVYLIFEQYSVKQSNKDGVLSVFALPSCPGLVYIEATSFLYTLTLLFRSSDRVLLYPSVLWNEVPCIVPLNERLDLLISLSPVHSFTIPSYVRVNKLHSLYYGDICFAITNKDTEWVEITLVPHIHLPGTSICPEAMLFNPHDYPGKSFILETMEQSSRSLVALCFNIDFLCILFVWRPLLLYLFVIPSHLSCISLSISMINFYLNIIKLVTSVLEWTSMLSSLLSIDSILDPTSSLGLTFEYLLESIRDVLELSEAYKNPMLLWCCQVMFCLTHILISNGSVLHI